MTIDFFPWRREETEDTRHAHEQAIAGDLDQRNEPGASSDAAPVSADGRAATDTPAVLGADGSDPVPAEPGMVRTLWDRRERIGEHPRESQWERVRLYGTLTELGRSG